MLGEPDVVVAQLVRELDLLERIPVDLGVALSLRLLEQEEESKSNLATLLSIVFPPGVLFRSA